MSLGRTRWGYLFALVMLALVFSACSGSESTKSDVTPDQRAAGTAATAFYTAAYREFAALDDPENSTPAELEAAFAQTVVLIDAASVPDAADRVELAYLTGSSVAWVFEEERSEPTIGKPQLITIDDDRASIPVGAYTTQSPGADPEDLDIELVRVDGKWLVDGS